MKNETLKKFAQLIVEKYKKKSLRYVDEKALERFVSSNLPEEKKIDALEQAYIFQVFSDGYVGGDPRGKNAFMTRVTIMFDSKNEEELDRNIELTKQAMGMFKAAELNPFQAFEKQLQDAERYKGVKL